MADIKITDVRSLPGDSAFLIDDGKTAIMYDSGFAFSGYDVADKIKAILGDRSLDYIFLTHSHYDHALGSVYAKRYWKNAKIVAGEYAAKIFAKDSARAVMRDLDRKFADKCGVGEYEDLIDELHVDIAAKDGDVIEAGSMKFRVISLPGHTKCSVGFYLEEEKLLLGCESLGVYKRSGDVVPSFLVGYRKTLDSIERASRLGAEKILVPHYGVIDKEAADNYFKTSAENTVYVAERIVTMLKEGASKDEIREDYMKRFYHDDLKSVYPVDAINLNTNITINLIEKELMSDE